MTWITIHIHITGAVIRGTVIFFTIITYKSVVLNYLYTCCRDFQCVLCMIDKANLA